MICIATPSKNINLCPSRPKGLRLEQQATAQSSAVVSTLVRRTFPEFGNLSIVGLTRQQIYILTN